MQSAAGGTSQRLNPDFATVCSRSRIPLPTPATVPALSTVAIRPSYISPTGRGHQLRSAEHLERLTWIVALRHFQHVPRVDPQHPFEHLMPRNMSTGSMIRSLRALEPQLNSPTHLKSRKNWDKRDITPHRGWPVR